uniref:Uncharacterized protein n=1 Tax=Rhizophora mucronata TaxID=61149 RepID=A0A2P2IXV5_RHIMU
MLAEDFVARGSLTLVSPSQDHLNSPQLNSYNLRWLANVSPTITVCEDDASYAGPTISGQNSGLRLGNSDNLNNGNLNGGIMSDAISCVSDIWP